MVFANKLFANIAGKSVQDKTDLVVIDAGESDIESFRNSWREGNRLRVKFAILGFAAYLLWGAFGACSS